MAYGYELDYYEAELVDVTEDLRLVLRIECGIGIKADRTCGFHELHIPKHKLEEARRSLEELIPIGSRTRLKLYSYNKDITLTNFVEAWTLDGRNLNRYLVEQGVAVEI